MKAFISISIRNRTALTNEVAAIIETLTAAGIQPFVFVDQYHFPADQEKEMMQTAMREIEDSDILIAELTEKAIGVGLEMGYAKGKNKVVIYLHQTGSEYSTTAGGLCDYRFEYADAAGLSRQLRPLLASILNRS